MAESKKSEEKATSEKTTLFSFSKEKILACKKYQKNRDVLSAILEDGKKYTHKQVSETLAAFYEKEVK